MPEVVRNVVVLGAGTMGCGIAAHLANLGFAVTVLDVSREGAIEGLNRARSARPPHFYDTDIANSVTTGSIGDDFDAIRRADWVVEAVVENPEVKRALYVQIAGLLRPDAFISTNTSGLEIAMLTQGMPDDFRRRFLGTHFFNPPRYLKLMELIPTAETDPNVTRAMTALLEHDVARRVVAAKDTPGFIANRFGMWSMFLAIHVAERLHLTVEQVDAITGPFIGRPKSGSFRLADIVGLDVMDDIARNLRARCIHDAHMAVLERPASMNELIARKWLGDKSGQGYYRKGGRELFAFDLATLAYRETMAVDLPTLSALGSAPLPDRLRGALDAKDEVGEYLRLYLLPALRYAESIREEVSYSVQDFDRVMRWGFGWEMGPFEMMDAIGPEGTRVEHRYYENGKVWNAGDYATPESEPQYAKLTDFPVVADTEWLRIRMVDEIPVVTTRTKQGIVTPALLAELEVMLDEMVGRRFVFTSESDNFSLGFDLKYFLGLAEASDIAGIEAALIRLQSVSEKFEAASAVAAVKGYALGGGLELALGCAEIVALAESRIGFPEANAGLIPGGRGTVLMRLNNQESARTLADMAMRLTVADTPANAIQARNQGYLRPQDIIEYHPDRLIMRAVERARESEPGARPVWQSIEGPFVGMVDRMQQDALRAERITEYDEVIGDKIKTIFGRCVSYDDAIQRERMEFLDLCTKSPTVARIRHMVEFRKPLRN